MSAADDGTIDLLTGPEGQLIAALGRNSVQSPTQLSRNLARARYWVAKDADALAKLGLVKITRLPKLTTYELSSQGRLLIEAVEARTTKTGRFLTGADLDTLAAEAEQGYDISSLAPVLCASCGEPVQGYARGRAGERLCHTDDRRCYRDYVSRGYRLKDQEQQP